MPKFALETWWNAELLASHCNDAEGNCPVLGNMRSSSEDWSAFICPFTAEKNCEEITPADWQALEVKDEVQ